MTLYTILPLETVFAGMDKVEQEEYVEVSINGVTMQVKPINAQQASIVRLLSCNPQDYLNPQYSPGRIIEFQAMVN
jgi:hypothetical protein